MKAIVATTVALCATWLTSCGGNGPDSVSLPFSVVDTSSSSLVWTHRLVSVRNQAEWAALWAEYRGTSAPLPAVDFSRNAVAGVFLGQRGSSCTSVAVTQVTDTGTRIIVEYTESHRLTCQTTASLAHPLQLVSFPAAAQQIEFVAKPLLLIP